MTGADYEATIRTAWAARDERLRDPYGWLSLAGLWWLHPGSNTFGADASNEIVLAGDGLPAHGGAIEVAAATVRLRPADPLVRVNGAAAESAILADDEKGPPSLIELGDLRMHVIRRGDRVALRVRDPRAAARTAFNGIERYPIDAGWRIRMRVESAAGREIPLMDVTGQVQAAALAGYVSFERDGATWRLAALEGEDDGSLWLIFGDGTNGHGTYGGGRYLYTEPMADDGSVVADFNLAYNPPCVFSPYATCPLPPMENRLALGIEAGERFDH